MVGRHFITVEDKRLETAYWGDGDKLAPTLVMLHEGLGCVELWKDFPQRLHEATGCNVFLYSRAGYGHSDPVNLPRPLTYMHEEGLNVLPKVLDETGLKNVVLFGHSDGGSIALINAGGVRDARVKGVITLAAHVFNEEICVQSIGEAKLAYEAGKLRPGLEKYHGSNVDNAFWGWNTAWLDPDFINWNLEEFLPGINVPLLVMQGRQDQYGNEHQVHAICEGAKDWAQPLFIEGCRHSPHFDQSEKVLAATQEFIEQVWGLAHQIKQTMR